MEACAGQLLLTKWDKKRHVATRGLLGRAQVNSVGCFLCHDFAPGDKDIFSPKWGPMRAESHLFTLKRKPLRLFYQSGFLNEAVNNNFTGINWWESSTSQVTVPSRRLLGKILCIEDSGGSSALVFTQSTRVHPVITEWWCQIIEAGWDLKLRTTAYSLFPLWVCGAKSLGFDLGRQPKHCGNKRCKASSVTYWFPAFPLAFSLSLLAAHLQTKASLLLLETSLVNSC